VRSKKFEQILLTGSAGGSAKTEPPPSAYLAKKWRRKGRFQVFRSAFSETLGFAQFDDKFFLYLPAVIRPMQYSLSLFSSTTPVSR
jgi:hypothetical protein